MEDGTGPPSAPRGGWVEGFVCGCHFGQRLMFFEQYRVGVGYVKCLPFDIHEHLRGVIAAAKIRLWHLSSLLMPLDEWLASMKLTRLYTGC